MLSSEGDLAAAAASNSPATPGTTPPTASNHSSRDRANRKPHPVRNAWKAKNSKPSTTPVGTNQVGIPKQPRHPPNQSHDRLDHPAAADRQRPTHRVGDL